VSTTPPASPPSPAEDPEDRRSSALEIVAGIILGLAATIAAFAAYQGALADGDALEQYTQANLHLSDANFFYNQGNQQLAQDQQVFVTYSVAAQSPGQEQAAEYIRTSLMTENLGAAVDWWLETDEAVTPFDDLEGNPYDLAELATADEEQAAADAAFEAGAEANKVGDQFELAGVILAIALFFGGIATLIKAPGVARGLLVVAGIATLGGAVLVVGALA
jgi:hypothetical protein